MYNVCRFPCKQEAGTRKTLHPSVCPAGGRISQTPRVGARFIRTRNSTASIMMFGSDLFLSCPLRGAALIGAASSGLVQSDVVWRHAICGVMAHCGPMTSRSRWRYKYDIRSVVVLNIRLFVCLFLFNGTPAPFGLLMIRTVEIETGKTC